MISTLLNLLLFIFILGLLIFVHELGHFLTAKKSGVYIYEFSIGMGPEIKSIKGKDGILYSIRALPIGGFVQMAGEIYEDDDTKKIPKEQFMCNRPWYQRLIILVAGVFNNFLLAIILLFAMALIWGAPSLKPVVYDVTDAYPAKEAGIKAGDVIKSINGSKVKTLDKTQLLLLLKTKDDKYQITVEHKNGQTATYEVVPKKEKNDDGDEVKVFGIQTKTNITKGFGRSLKYAFTKFGSVVEQMWLTIVNLFTGKISISAMSVSYTHLTLPPILRV